MSLAPYAAFASSARPAPPGTRVGAVDEGERITVSVYLKPHHRAAGERMSREALAERRGADHASDVQRVEAFAAAHGLTAVAEPARRLVRLTGTAAQMQTAFQTELGVYEHDGCRFRGRTGVLHLPQDLHAVIEAVLGLDTRPQAQPRFQRAVPAATATATFLPTQIASLYNFPVTPSAAGQCIGLIELGGGYTDADTQAAFAAMNLAPPSVVAIPVDGAQNAPGGDADTEVALDIQVAGGAAPGATIAVYFAPNTDAGFADAISAAVHDATNKPGVISISWGGPEPSWTSQAAAAMNSALQDADTVQVSVFVASGDSLATDGVNDGAVHVDFPASSPYAIGCGGTFITVSGGAIASEVVWNDGTSGTGGGISVLTPTVPAFQSGVTLPPNASTGGTGRGVPDVAGNAAPSSGYSVVVGGQSGTVGGTSAVAPLWAALAALINAGRGANLGFFLPTLYGASGATQQITQGNNMPAGTMLGYRAGPGWNACTGLGSPNGVQVAAALQATAGV